MWPNPQFPGDLVTFTEEILNQKLFLYSDMGIKNDKGGGILIWYIAGMAFDEDACDQNITLLFFLPSVTGITPIPIPSQDFASREN